MTERFLCRRCRHPVGPKMKTCIECGSPLDGRSRVPIAAVTPPLMSHDRTVPNEPTQDRAEPTDATPVDPAHAPLIDLDDHAAGQPQAAANSTEPSDQSKIAGSTETADGTTAAEPPVVSIGSRTEGSAKASRSDRRRRVSKRSRRPFDSVRPNQVEREPEPPDPVPAPSSLEEDRDHRSFPVDGNNDFRPGSHPFKRREKGVVCRHCDVENKKDRTFCDSCRQPLWVTDGRQRGRTGAVKEPIFRRLMGTKRSGGVDTRLWSQRLRDRQLDRSLRHRTGMTPGSRLGFAAAAVGLVAAVALFFGPLRQPIARFVSPPTENVVFSTSVSFADVGDEDSTRLSDGSLEKALQLPWDSTPPDGVACAESEAPTIRLQFDPAAHPKTVRLYVGLDPVDENESPELFPGPRTVSVVGDTGCLGPVELVESGWASIDVTDVVGEGPTLEIVLLARWDDPNVATYPVMAVAEIELLR